MIVNSDNKILILEDSPFLVELLSEQFARLYGVNPAIKFTSLLSEFKAICSQQHFNAFIVDLNVVDAKASEVAAALNQLSTDIRERVIIHSSESLLNMRRLGLMQFKRVPKGPTDFELLTVLKEVQFPIET